MLQPAPLDAVLSYADARILSLYEQNYPRNTLRAKDAFAEVPKYMWLTQVHAQERQACPDDASLPRHCLMLRSMREIDEMWHEFILFTREYMAFCEQYFGAYVHHMPNVFDTMPMHDIDNETEITKLLTYVYNKLGAQTAQTWFASYL